MPITDKGPILFSPIRGRHYIVGRFNVATDEIYFDDNEPAPRLGFMILIPFLERIMTFPFTWQQLMTEEEAYAKNLRPLLTYEKNVKSSDESGDKVAPQKMCLVRRHRDDQHYLLDREVHPFDLRIVPTDGGEIKFIIKFTLLIEDAKRIYSEFPSGNFLSYAQDIISTKLGNKYRTMKLDELRGKDAEGVIDETDDVLNEINETEFKDHSFKLLKIMVEDIVILPATQQQIAEIQKVSIERIKIEGELHKKEQLLIQANAEANATKIKGNAKIEIDTKRTIDVGNAEAKVLGEKITKILNYQQQNKALVDKTKEVVSYNHKNVTTLVETGGTKDSDVFEQVLVAEVTTKGGSNGNN